MEDRPEPSKIWLMLFLITAISALFAITAIWAKRNHTKEYVSTNGITTFQNTTFIIVTSKI